MKKLKMLSVNEKDIYIYKPHEEVLLFHIVIPCLHWLWFRSHILQAILLEVFR